MYEGTWRRLVQRLRSCGQFCMSKMAVSRHLGFYRTANIADMTGLPNIGDIITERRHTLFGHVVRLEATTPAHQALEQVIATKAGRFLGTNWRRPPGRPRRTWIQQVGKGTPGTNWRRPPGCPRRTWIQQVGKGTPGTNWRRPPGRPRRKWIQQVGERTPASWRQM